MKFLIAFVAVVAVAVAGSHKPVSSAEAELAEIIAAINSPNTDPATAHLLEQMLEEIIAATVQDTVSVGPAIIEQEPVSLEPVIVDFPLPEGALAPTPVEPSPVVVGPIAPGSPAPLVQLIVNVNQAGASPVQADPIVRPEPVGIIDEAEIVDPVIVVDSPVEVDPVQVVDVAPVPVEPVQVGTPIIPAPAVVLPDELN